MSRENVETIRRVYDAFARGDFRSALDIYDRHVVLLQGDDANVFGLDVSGVYWGVDGLKEYMRQVFETWSSVRIEAEEIITAGDSVVAAILMRVVGRGSGVPTELRYFHVWTFRGDSVIRLELVPTREEALEAVGLRSRENVELVRRIFEAGARRDSATALGLYDPALVWDVSRLEGADFEGGVFHGHDGLRRWFREWFAAWENVRNDLEELIDAGDSVISVTTQRSRGQASGVEVELKQYAVWTIEGGKVTRVTWFQTRDEALEAVGLRE
jgi:uncharacterized protein